MRGYVLRGSRITGRRIARKKRLSAKTVYVRYFRTKIYKHGPCGSAGVFNGIAAIQQTGISTIRTPVTTGVRQAAATEAAVMALLKVHSANSDWTTCLMLTGQ